MKNSLFIICFLSLSKLMFAQSSTAIDKEKLFDFYQTQRYAEAAQYLKTAYTESTSDLKAVTQIGYCYLMAGNTAEAEKYYLKAYQLQPKSLPILFSMANIAGRRNNVEKAKNYYEEIIKIDTANFAAYKQLTSLYPEQFNIKKINYLKKANKLNPLDADIVFDLSEIYMKMHIFSLVDSILKPALNADSNSIQLLKIKLPLCLAENKFDEAIKSGEQLFSLGDSSSFVLNNLGKVYYMKKEFVKSLNYFKKVRSNAPDDNESLFYNMALCYRGLKDYITAGDYFKKAIDAGISRNTLLYYTKMGESYEQAEKFELAASAYKKGAFFDTESNLIYIAAQIFDKKLNQKANAISAYNQVLRNLPDTEGNKPVVEYINKRLTALKN